MKLIKYHLPTIERIIVNHSYSNLTVEGLEQDMKLTG